MSTTAPKKRSAGNAARLSLTDSGGASSPSALSDRGPRTSTPTGSIRGRSSRSGTPVSARAAASRRDVTSDTAESDARAEASAAVEDLQRRLEKEEKLLEQQKKQADVLQAKLGDAVKESASLEERLHEQEEQLEALRNEKRDATRQMREMENIYEAERSAILKEKEELANREEEMQTIIQRLKDNLAQRGHGEDEAKLSRQGTNSSPSPLDGGGFAPPSSLQRSDSRNSSKLILQKDKLIESLRIELAEAHVKMIESENQDGGRLREVERMLIESRMANARLVEENESYQLLLKEKTLKGEIGQTDFSYMGAASHQEALNALEGTGGGSTLADELSNATAAESDGYRRLEAELKSMNEQNKALTLYINKIIERLLRRQDFESILDQSGDSKAARPEKDKDLPALPGENPSTNGLSLLQRAKSMALGSSRSRPRPVSVMPPPTAASSAHTDPETAPSIPFGNLGRSASTRWSRPQSDQFSGTASLVGQLYRSSEGPASPGSGSGTQGSRNSPALLPANFPGSNANGAARTASGVQLPLAGIFSGMRSETSSLSGDSGDVSTPPSQSPPRSHSDKQTTFAGSKPRPLRLVQENQEAVKDNKRASWYSGWTWGAKKEDSQPSAGASIPE